jgi:uncharacterized protein YukE
VPDQTHIDAEGTAKVARTAVAAGQAFDTALATLKSALSSLDGCWGGDKIGKNFATNYVSNAAGTLDQAGQLAQSVDAGTGTLQQTPEQFQNVDSSNGQGIAN